MTLKGEYSGLTSYSVGDVVQWTDGTIYVLKHPAPAGTPPTDTLRWERAPQSLQDTVDLIIEAVELAKAGALTGKVANNLTTTASGKVLDARQGKELKTLISNVAGDLADLNPDVKTLVLKSSTASSTKMMAITVDDDGELTATEITGG